MSKRIRLADGAKIFRSKNAGPFRTTIDIFYTDPKRYAAIRSSGQLTPETVAAALELPLAAVEGIFFSDQVLGIKITVLKQLGMASGELRCADTFGTQQYVPLSNLEVEVCSQR